MKKEFQFFETPHDLARDLARMAYLENHDTILEPSAGQGAIIKAINMIVSVTPDCYELMDVNRAILKQKQDVDIKFNLIGEDFLKHEGKTYSKIITNPPFNKNQDIDHIMHMYMVSGKIVIIEKPLHEK